MIDVSVISQKSKIPGSGTALVALRVILGVVFVLSGLAKMWDLYGFSQSIASYNILPSALLAPISIIIPFAELVLGLMLTLNYHPRFAVMFLLALMMTLTGLTAVKYFGGNRSDCGCFGNMVRRPLGWTYFLSNAALLLGLVVAGGRRVSRSGGKNRDK